MTRDTNPKFDSNKHHRKSIRLQGYDYSQAGAYFVTIVTYQRGCLFGKIIDGEMYINDYGRIVQKWWNEIPIHFPNVELGAFVIMPNQVHGIIWIIDNRRGEVLSPRDNPNILTTGINCGFKLELFGSLVRLENDDPTSTYARDTERNSLPSL